VVTRPLLENGGIFFPFQTVPRDFSSLQSAKNGSEGQAAFCSVSWLSALWQCGCGVNLTTHFHLEPRLRMSGLVTPILHGVQSEKVTSLLIMSGILRIIRKSAVIAVFRDVIHIIYHGVISKTPYSFWYTERK
jgi:hypothetical protein